MAKKFYAHSVEGKPVDEWHTLEEHLKGTAELVASFAAEFLAAESGEGWRGCGMIWGSIPF